MAQIMTLLPGTISARADNSEVVMACSIPMVQSYFNVADLQRWTITIEEIMSNKHSFAHQLDLEGMYRAFRHMLEKHQEQHEEVLSSEPSADDLQAYLASYSTYVAQS